MASPYIYTFTNGSVVTRNSQGLFAGADSCVDAPWVASQKQYLFIGYCTFVTNRMQTSSPPLTLAATTFSSDVACILILLGGVRWVVGRAKAQQAKAREALKQAEETGGEVSEGDKRRAGFSRLMFVWIVISIGQSCCEPLAGGSVVADIALLLWALCVSCSCWRRFQPGAQQLVGKKADSPAK